jgi:hypothetical protein
MPQDAIEYQNVAEHSRERNARRARVSKITGVAVVVALLLPVVAFFVYLNYHQVWSVRWHFVNSPDWDVVEVTGYSEDPGYSVTGVLLAAKGRPEATVRLGFNQYTSLLNNEEIAIVSIKDVDAEDVSTQLLSDPRVTERQRTELMFRYYDAIDVKSTGEFGNLFPRVRDLKELRARYDEVYETMRSLAAGPATNPAQ